MLIAIDTSTAQTGIACFDEAGLLAECVWEARRDHTAQLLPQIDLLLRHTRRQPADLRAVAVALGPGSWSGLRVGLSTAKGLALGLSLPIIGVSTLDALVFQYAGTGLPVCPLIRLGRDRFATLEPGGTPANTTLTTLGTQIRMRTLFCGDIDHQVRKELTELLGERASFPAPAAALRRPGYLAELAWRRFYLGATDQLANLEPIYLGQPVRLATA